MNYDIITNAGKKYVILGEDFGILNSKEVEQLPLNDIDLRIIEMI